MAEAPQAPLQEDPSEPPEPGPAASRLDPDEGRSARRRGVTPEDLLTAIQGLDTGEKSWWHSLLLLVISLFVFASLGLFNSSPQEVGLLIGVLFIHEGGHYLGMRLFNYRNVKMFFIPFLGAAVSGQKTHVEGWKQAVVCLLGPLPGIFIGLVLASVNAFKPDPFLWHLASLFVILNAFQLLPIYPLDGGRFLNEVLFVRSRHLESGFRVVAGLVALTAAFFLRDWLIGMIGFFVLTSASHAWRIGSLTRDMRELGMEPLEDHERESLMPLEVAYVMLPDLLRVFPNTIELRTLATYAKEVWEKLCARPPGMVATLLLMGAYLGTFVAMFAGILIFSVTLQFGYERNMQSGNQEYLSGHFAAAEPHFRKALKSSDTFAADDLRRSDVYNMLGLTMYELQDYKEAEHWLREELKQREKVQGPQHPDLASVLSDLAMVLEHDQARMLEALQLEIRAKQIREATAQGASNKK